MKKKTKHYFSFVVIVFAVLCWFSMDTSAAYGAYEALETNYKNTFNPDTLAGYPETGTYVLDTLVYNPGKDTFRLYLPQGAIRVNLKLSRLVQDAKIGAVVRMGQYPQCTYNIAPDEYYDLPWGSSDGTSVAALDGKDFQARYSGGAICILSSATVSASDAGEWIYVKVLKYDSTVVGSVVFEVTVDAEDYKAWYDGYDWDGNNPSQPFSGSTGGFCDPVWEEGGATGGGGGGGTGGGGGYPIPDFPIPDPVPDPNGTGQHVEGNNMYLSVDVGSGEAVISKTDFYSIPSMILKQVEMVFENPPQGLVHCYAAYLKDDDLYVAEKDLGGNIVFMRYRENDTLKSYAAYNFGSGTTYRCTAFERLDEMNSAILSEHGVLFACLVVAEDGSAHGMVFGFDG